MSRQTTALILIAAFAALTLCGWGFFITRGEHGIAMAGCPFASPMIAVCPSSALGHLTQYNALIGSVAVSTIVTALAALMFLAFVTFKTSSFDPLPSTGLQRPQPSVEGAWRPLQLAFSDGILNPKVY
jgi:hypothetical protein